MWKWPHKSPDQLVMVGALSHWVSTVPEMRGAWTGGHMDKCLVRCLKWPKILLRRASILIFCSPFYNQAPWTEADMWGRFCSKQLLGIFNEVLSFGKQNYEKIFLYANANLRTLCTLGLRLDVSSDFLGGPSLDSLSSALGLNLHSNDDGCYFWNQSN